MNEPRALPAEATAVRAEPSPRFLKKRELILDAAADLIELRGLKGLTLVGVAEAVGLNTTSVTYYFRRKEALAAAALDRAIGRLEEMARQAGEAPTPRARAEAWVEATLDLHARVRRGEDRRITLLSDIRALEEPMRGDLIGRYLGVRRVIQGWYGPSETPRRRALVQARAQVLMDCLLWMRAWLPAYSAEDFPRVQARLMDLFDGGLAAPGAVWAPRPLGLDAPGEEEVGREAFLRAATGLMNERGYRGASVEGISARLNVSKGSFYHHLENKDDLVMDCFERSYQRVSRAQRQAIDGPGTFWDRLCTASGALLEAQFATDFPLLRITALQALPPELRADVLRRSDRMAQRFAGMMIDGITEGSVRPVDPLIASQCIMAMVNGAFDMRPWAEVQGSPEAAVETYAATLFFGLFD